MSSQKFHDKLVLLATKDLNVNHPVKHDVLWPVKDCWHFSSDGNYAEALFYDRQDYIDAMNRIGTLSLRFPMLILAFCLMDNHFHFVLYGRYEDCNKFVHEFMRLTGCFTTTHGQAVRYISVSSVSGRRRIGTELLSGT